MLKVSEERESKKTKPKNCWPEYIGTVKEDW